MAKEGMGAVILQKEWSSWLATFIILFNIIIVISIVIITIRVLLIKIFIALTITIFEMATIVINIQGVFINKGTYF